MPITTEIATDWGLISSHGKQNGYSTPVIDTLLAATARHLDLVLVTRNVADLK